jgi:DNA-binding NarL/FixJ family response regulator
MQTIRLIVLDDHAIVRDGIRAMLIGNSSIKMIGEAADYPSLLERIKQEPPDIIITDIKLGGAMTGIEIAATVKKEFPGIKILMLSGNLEDHYVLAAIKAGATGFLSKDTGKEEFLAAVKSVYNGQTYFGEAVSHVIIDQYVRQAKHTTSGGSLLSEREMEIVHCLCQGLTTKETGEQLCISSRTVESHKNNILEKLGLSNTVELVRHAIREKWIDP